jgi:hypothetical protein
MKRSNPIRNDVTASTPDSVLEISDTAQWHRTSRLSDGTPIGRLGAYWYVLDDDGRAISDGYHEIHRDEDGEYEGTRSARAEPVAFHAESERE